MKYLKLPTCKLEVYSYSLTPKYKMSELFCNIEEEKTEHLRCLKDVIGNTYKHTKIKFSDIIYYLKSSNFKLRLKIYLI